MERLLYSDYFRQNSARTAYMFILVTIVQLIPNRLYITDTKETFKEKIESE